MGIINVQKDLKVTEEVAELKGIDYNPNWGVQAGEIRNAKNGAVSSTNYYVQPFL